MVLLVVKTQRLQRCVEFISTPHLLTNVAKMMGRRNEFYASLQSLCLHRAASRCPGTSG